MEVGIKLKLSIYSVAVVKSLVYTFTIFHQNLNLAGLKFHQVSLHRKSH